jgi:hypothetical protein
MRPVSRGVAAKQACLFGSLVLLAIGCTYGPIEERATVDQIVRLGDSYQAIAVIKHVVFQRPTGLSAFPDGGRWRLHEQRAREFLLDAEACSALPLASQEAPDSLWQSFDAHIVGVEGDSAVYVKLTGCPRNEECYAATRQALVRLSRAGSVRSVERVPPAAVLPGVMLARAPGEERYVRFGTSGLDWTRNLSAAWPRFPDGQSDGQSRTHQNLVSCYDPGATRRRA